MPNLPPHIRDRLMLMNDFFRRDEKLNRQVCRRRRTLWFSTLLGLTLASGLRAEWSPGTPGALLAEADLGSAGTGDEQSRPARERLLDVIGTPDAASGKWSVEFGVAIISDNTPNDYFKLDFDRLEGPGSGLTYNLTVARTIADFDWKLWGVHLRPQLEVPFRLTLVDQQEGGLLPDVNLGVAFRWRNWPWNRWLQTTFAVGAGLSYSSPVWTADLQRHPGESRSELKWWMPLEFTFALPKHPNYQIVAFGDHQSGGAIFDLGGVDAWGFGFRVVF